MVQANRGCDQSVRLCQFCRFSNRPFDVERTIVNMLEKSLYIYTICADLIIYTDIHIYIYSTHFLDPMTYR